MPDAHDPRPAPTHDLAQPPARAVPLHGAADAATARDEPDTRGLPRSQGREQQAMTAAQRLRVALHRRIIDRRAEAVRGADAFGPLSHAHTRAARRRRAVLRASGALATLAAAAL